MKVNATEHSFLVMLSNVGGRHRFGPDDNVTRETHRMLRSLKGRGYITVEEENSVATVTLTSQGQEEANG